MRLLNSDIYCAQTRWVPSACALIPLERPTARRCAPLLFKGDNFSKTDVAIAAY
jgi:hypothetical protein